MELLRINRALVRVGRALALATAACVNLCCGVCNYWVRYDPCPPASVNCPNFTPPTAPIFVRCSTQCPGGCGVLAGTTLPLSVRHAGWCYTRVALQYYAPEEFPPPQNPPPGLLPIPPNGIRATTLDSCNSEGCGAPCCRCFAWYCAQPCTCSGGGSVLVCAAGDAVRAGLALGHPCLVGISAPCAPFDARTPGYDTRPPGSRTTDVQPGSCCTCVDSLCARCRTRQRNIVQTNYCCGAPPQYLSVPCGASGPGSRTCCCDPTNVGVQVTYEFDSSFSLASGFFQRVSTRGSLTCPIGAGEVAGTFDRTINDNGFISTDHPGAALVADCDSAFALNTIGPDQLFGQPMSVKVTHTIMTTCQSTLWITEVRGCGTSNYTATRVMRSTLLHGPNSLACRQGCFDRPESSAPKRIPTPLELMG